MYLFSFKKHIALILIFISFDGLIVIICYWQMVLVNDSLYY